MAHSLRAAALTGTLMFAALAVRCDSETFDLFPEFGAGSGGKPSTGGKNSSSNGGMTGSGNTGANTGHLTGGRSGGGQFNGGATSFGGFGVVTGGRIGQPSGGFAGKPIDFPPQECTRYCAATGCIPCIPPSPNSGDTGGCPLGLVCPTNDLPFALKCPYCVPCAVSSDCKSPLSTCDDNKTCTRQCDGDGDCSTSVPDRPYCNTSTTNNNISNKNLCTECKNQDNKLCKAPLLCARNGDCVECLGFGDCDRNPFRKACDAARGVCIECKSDFDCEFNQISSGWCALNNNTCMCSDNDQCKGSPFGPLCILGHCRECSQQQPCSNGESCDSNGQCVR